MGKKVSDKVLSRIKKLMALGLGDPDSPESKSAMDKVAKLMQEHGVAEIDLDADGHVNVDALLEEFVEVYSKKTDRWERALGHCIAVSFDCRMITLISKSGLPTRSFVGTRSDVDLSIYFYKFIRMQIMKRAEKLHRLVADQKAYGYGCTIKVNERLKEMYTKREEVMTSDSHALILIKKDDVTKFYNKKYPSRKKGSAFNINNTNADAFNQGIKDGDKIKMSQQVGNKSATGATMIGG